MYYFGRSYNPIFNRNSAKKKLNFIEPFRDLQVLYIAWSMGKTDEIVDELLVLQCQSGSKKAMTLLVGRYHLKLCKHAYWYTHDIDASKDIVQDCWTTILRKINGLRDPKRFGSWSRRIVTRKSLDYMHRVKKDRDQLKTISLDIYDDQLGSEKEHQIKKLHQAITGLPRDQQLVIRLFYTEDYSLREIGTVLEISTGTVKSRLYHAREKLKTILIKQDHEE